jgi:hypothetical protein
MFDDTRERVRSALDGEALERALADGRRLTLESALALALEATAPGGR